MTNKDFSATNINNTFIVLALGTSLNNIDWEIFNLLLSDGDTVNSVSALDSKIIVLRNQNS